ncbi:hypothetical protein GCM10009854_49420 [Saccharopolyspora halophila]|uniref:DUF3040 domain-containing protein n=1 Tax=Saccharopolyspora halophila TaxID=405551 RepID=A0ABN3GXT1_9PSEU
MLSRYEKRRLREIEAWFVQDDPRFAEYVRTGVNAHPGGNLVRTLNTLVGIGLVVVVLGSLAGLPLMVFIGICCAIGALASGSWLRWKRRQNSG